MVQQRKKAKAIAISRTTQAATQARIAAMTLPLLLIALILAGAGRLIGP